MDKKKLFYLSLQVTRQGNASYAHVHEIIAGLRNRGWVIQLFEPYYSTTSPSGLRRLWRMMVVQAKLIAQLGSKMDVLYIRGHFGAFVSAFIAKYVFKIPVVQEVNGPYEDLFITWPITRHFSHVFKFLMRQQFRWADLVIAVTPQLARWVTNESGNANVRIVPNGANVEMFRPNLMRPGLIPHGPYVAFVGNLAPWQGIDVILDATTNPKWPDDVTLVCVGDGIERPRVEQRVKKQGNILYLGKMPYEEVPSIISNAVAAMSIQNNLGSRSETGLYPLKVFETLACGVPVIVSNYPGQADIVRDNRCGIVLDCPTEESIAEAVGDLSNSPLMAAEMGSRGRELVVSFHSWDARSSDTNEIIEEMLVDRDQTPPAGKRYGSNE